MRPRLARRVGELEQAFVEVQRTRMAGVPVLNPRLRVQAVGFASDAEPEDVAWGVLVTPWFMNLVRLPLAETAARALLPAGHKAWREAGTRGFEFIGGEEAALGRYEACSLFSPMFEFTDHGAALATAEAVLQQLRQPAAAARRGFLFGRGNSREPA